MLSKEPFHASHHAVSLLLRESLSSIIVNEVTNQLCHDLGCTLHLHFRFHL
ncbi:unnamed protein product [Arabidopsis halleri]